VSELAALALIQAEDDASAILTEQATASALTLFNNFDDWYNFDAITGWARRLAGLVENYQRITANTADSYIARAVRALVNKTFQPVGAIDPATARSNVITHPGVYGRVADMFRWQQAKIDRAYHAAVVADTMPPELVEPQEAAATRLTTLVAEDMQLARRNQTHKTLNAAASRSLVTGWRRVIHPELSRQGTCGLCVAASTRIYRVEDLMPLHPGCHCLPAPVYRDRDPGGAINESDLGRIYAVAGGSTAKEDLRKTRFRVDEHGEIGPVLRPENQPIRTEGQARRDSDPAPRRAKTPAQRRATVRSKRDTMQADLNDLRSRHADDPPWQPILARMQARIDTLDQAS
jgi:hypothetical protein